MQIFNFARRIPGYTALWRELTIYSVYRLFLASVLATVFYLKLPPEFLGATNPYLYEKVSLIYLITAILFFGLTVKKVGGFDSLARVQLVLDIVFLTLLINYSGGLSTGLGLLLVVVVVAGGALIPGKLSIFIAAIATLAVLLEVSYSQITGDGVTKYSHAGMLGATFFATALLAQILTHKMKITQLLADKRAQDISKLAALNQHIISCMETGIIVVDNAGRVTLSNQSARQFLDIDETKMNYSLKYLAPILAEQFKKMKNHTLTEVNPFQVRADLPEVSARFTTLESGETVIYINNTSALAQQVQQLKLASLGRLTASIAHEIRNPLGAISHAGELLAEMHENDLATTKLTDIIQRHSKRMNGIIETILDMSRRKMVEPATIILALWLDNFIAEFSEINHINKQDIELTVYSSLARVKMDEEQLHQVMCNLLNNAWHYSIPNNDLPRVTVTLVSDDNNVMIDIKDNGKGVGEEMEQQLFEPFHSSRQGGTGLGLYLARELCLANGAQLNYLPHENGCCFRISIPIEKQEILH